MEEANGDKRGFHSKITMSNVAFSYFKGSG
jgi:hypothetical protein